MRQRRFRSLLLVVISATAVGSALSLLARAPGLPGDLWRWELATYDYRLRSRADLGRSPNILIVAIDTNSMLTQGTWPWPRSTHARLVEKLSTAGASVILLDIVFDMPSSREEDQALAEAIQGSGRTVLTGEMIEELVMIGEGDLAMPVVRTLRPMPELEEAAAGMGVSMLPRDSDGTVRRVRLAWQSPDGGEERLLFSGVVAAAAAQGVSPEEYCRWWSARSHNTHPWVADADLMVDYRAPPPRGFKYVSYSSVLNDEIAPGVFRDKIVMVGSATGMNPDLTLHPFGSPKVSRESEGTGRPQEAFWERSEMPGVECIAHITDMLLERRVIVPADMLSATLLPIIYSAVVALFVVLVGSVWGLLTTVALLGMHWFAASYGIIAKGVWLPVASVALAGFGSYPVAAALLWLLEERAARKLRNTWQRRVSGEILEQILSHPELGNIPGRRVDATVVFMDLVGFTSLSTQMEPEELITYLNEYMALATEVARAHGGVVHKFIGDGVMIVYGQPVDIGNHARKAVNAAYDFQNRMKQLRESVEAQGGPELRARVGMHSGELIAGDVGPEALLEYTVLGKSVNLASRLEGLNKKLDSTICVSKATYERLEEPGSLSYAGRHEVAGYPDPVDVYTDSEPDQPDQNAAGGPQLP